MLHYPNGRGKCLKSIVVLVQIQNGAPNAQVAERHMHYAKDVGFKSSNLFLGTILVRVAELAYALRLGRRF